MPNAEEFPVKQKERCLELIDDPAFQQSNGHVDYKKLLPVLGLDKETGKRLVNAAKSYRHRQQNDATPEYRQAGNRRQLKYARSKKANDAIMEDDDDDDDSFATAAEGTELAGLELVVETKNEDVDKALEGENLDRMLLLKREEGQIHSNHIQAQKDLLLAKKKELTDTAKEKTDAAQEKMDAANEKAAELSAINDELEELEKEGYQLFLENNHSMQNEVRRSAIKKRKKDDDSSVTSVPRKVVFPKEEIDLCSEEGEVEGDDDDDDDGLLGTVNVKMPRKRAKINDNKENAYESPRATRTRSNGSATRGSGSAHKNTTPSRRSVRHVVKTPQVQTPSSRSDKSTTKKPRAVQTPRGRPPLGSTTKTPSRRPTRGQAKTATPKAASKESAATQQPEWDFTQPIPENLSNKEQKQWGKARAAWMNERKPC